ncbi:transcriptional repressor ILP1 [Mercurialis annua]|uniref:transcriptional repressor ILP1 n=1 Tax=Mercurialis annua TaxID=3986 RepID=UPI0021603341|nr:transcriptional repressor ILP1 [Mercurialis annua]
MSSASAKSRNFRRRGDEDIDDDGNKDSKSKIAANSTTTPALSLSSSRKPPSTKPKKLLSFADDEETDEQTPRISTKSSSSNKPKATKKSSHKLTVAKDRQPPSNSTATANNNNNSNLFRPQAGTYTKEALLELQKNTRTLFSKPSSSSAEPKIILKGLLKPTQDDLTSRQDNQGDHGEDDAGDFHSTNDRFSSLGLIPDEDTIRKIRARKERLRKSRVSAPDYISLDGGGGGGSNLGTAEGFSDEEPEFRTRVAMVGLNNKKESALPGGVFDDFDNGSDVIGPNVRYAEKESVVVDDNEEDEEDKIWEEEQFRKALGGNKRMDDAASASAIHKHHQLQPPLAHNSTGTTAAVTSIGGASQPLDALSIPQQALIATKALQQTLSKFKESHARTVMSLAKTDDNLSASLMNITALEKSLSAAGEKYIFMQKLRHFVSDICEFLQDKAPFIEELEEQMQTLHKQRASAILERRTSDNHDEMIGVEIAIKAARQVFCERGSSEAVIAAATSAAQDASAAKEQSNLAVKLDEFGRDINQQKRMDMKRRADARQRRRAHFESKRLSSMDVDGTGQKIEGESSTDESDSESAAYQSNRDLLLHTAGQIFGDASEEYSQLSMVKERFEIWKKEYSVCYRDAYMSLSVPAIFSPYVRLELLKWDPLHEDADFFNMKWHSLLSDYGLPENGSDPNPGDADPNLVPELVAKVAIPILHHEIAHCWDILSTRETENAVSATNLVTDYVPPSSEALAELLVAIRTRLADAVADIMVPTWSPLELKAVPNAARIAAYRFGMSVRLMKNICLWKDMLSLPVLEKLALDELLCGKVLPHLQSIANNVHDAITRTERIIASLSGVWAGPSVITDRSHKLQRLVGYIMSLAKRLKDKHPSGVSETETSGLARRLKKMLVELNDYDKAREIARMFGLREAL